MTLTEIRAWAHDPPKELKRFLKFATVGAIGAITDITVLNILVQLFSVSSAPAKAVGFCAAVVQNFYLNQRWTFPESQERNTRNQLFKFGVVSLVGLGINMLVFLAVDSFLKSYWQMMIEDPDLAFFVSYNFATLCAIGVVLFWNFTANRFWTYRGL